MLHYISTRGQAPRLNFGQATLAGLAADGGLYVPEAFPQLSGDDLSGLAAQTYLENAWRVMLPFADGAIDGGVLINMLNDAYKGFTHPDIAPLRPMPDGDYLLELFHGPTLAFKDYALQVLSRLFDHIVGGLGMKMTVVGATSGDTGSAAIEAFRHAKNARIVILHPHNRVSPVQRRQMTTVDAPNVLNIAVEGSFDDCQNIVKAMFNDESFRHEMHLSAVNSINCARIIAQVVYYVHAATHLSAKTGRRVNFCVPTGNFGNAYAAYVARSMGADIGKIIVATNSNDILHRFFSTGKMARATVVPTISPSMDIQVSSNIERLLFDLFGRSGEKTADVMKHFTEKGPIAMEADLRNEVDALFASGMCDDARTREVMRGVWDEQQYLVDPHTAVGLGVTADWKKKNPDELVVTLATAHPAKFPAAVMDATGQEPPVPDRFAGLFDKKEVFNVLPPDLKAVQDHIRRHIGKP